MNVNYRQSLSFLLVLLGIALYGCSQGAVPGNASSNGDGELLDTPTSTPPGKIGETTADPSSSESVVAKFSLGGGSNTEPDQPQEVLFGSTVTLTWDVSEPNQTEKNVSKNVAKSSLAINAINVTLFKNEALLESNLPLKHSYDIVATEDATYTLKVLRNDKEEVSQSITVKASDTICLGKKNCQSHSGVENGFLQIFYQPFAYQNEAGETCLMVPDSWNHRVVQMCGEEIEKGKFGLIFGQKDSSSNLSNQGGDPNLGTLNGPRGVWSNGKITFIADTDNHRILVWLSPPVSSGAPADLVLGQPDGKSNAANRGRNGPSANSLRNPSGIWFDETTRQLFVADANNSRILIKNWGSDETASLSDVDFGDFDIVVGQEKFTDNRSNRGGRPGANTLNVPHGVSTFNGKLFISDSGNNRILVFDPIPENSNASANGVIGQADLVSNNVNRGTSNYDPWSVATITPRPSEVSLTYPVGVYGQIVDGKEKLWISDKYNDRILRWDTETQKGDRVLGFDHFDEQLDDFLQEDQTVIDLINEKFLGNTAAAPPIGCRLFVNATTTRILEFDICGERQNGAEAIRVIGQPNFHSIVRNKGPVSDHNLNDPISVWGDDLGLWIVSGEDLRVVGFSKAPSVSGAKAQFILGQNRFDKDDTEENANVPGRKKWYPESVSGDGRHFVVADTRNSRVLIWQRDATGAPAGEPIVVGQSGLDKGEKAPRGNPNCNQFYPSHAAIDSHHLFVTDTLNNRILVFEPIPETNGPLPSFTIGPPDCRTKGPSSLSYPQYVFSDGEHLLITDKNNNRILFYNTIPTSSETQADFIIGKTGAASKQTLNRPYAAVLYKGLVFVVDNGNQRVMVFQKPVGNYPEAVAIIGQNDFSGSKPNGGGKRTKDVLSSPMDLWVQDDLLYVAEGNRGNQRVLVRNIKSIVDQFGETPPR